jgi:hypoxanthine phosphoribosyltransferase
VKTNLDEIWKIFYEADRIFTHEEVESALDRMATEIIVRLSETYPLALCVMHGGLITAGRLLTRLHFPLDSGYLHVTRYGHQTSGKQIEWKVRPSEDIRGRSVLLVDDILDEGRTLSAVIDYCRSEGAKEVLTAVLVLKEHQRKARTGMTADFVGLVSPDRFLFGCGMDYKGYWRNAAGIYAVKGL